MDIERWDYKIDGKLNGLARIVGCFVLFVLFVVLCIDQLQPQPNKYLTAAYSLGIISIVTFCLLIYFTVRYFYFKVYIGSTGFYFQSTPFNGKYYEYLSVENCREERRRYRGSESYYYFFFSEKDGRTIKFQYEKDVCEREINVLKKRIEKANESLHHGSE